jgi:hypothetical protein
MKLTCILLALLSLIGTALAVADDKPTSISDARAAIEANMRTAEGKAYDEQMGEDFMQKYLDNLRQCKRTAGGSQESFWILLKLDKDGSVKQVLLSPVTKAGSCDRDALSKAKLLPPPHGDYWVGIYLNSGH